ncbi:hypothetical protein [Paenibacillus sp. 1P03SA]|uniref:hypothetical protein n=1 Tax=Paenibacillus sp. 1P03SA TaxID=3132294 RepID=UPI00399FEC91
MELKKLCEIDYPSQEFLCPPQILRENNNVKLEFDYESESGEYKKAEIIFLNTIGYKCCSLECTPAEAIAAYDKICVVKNSDWLQVVKNNYRGLKDFDYNHYCIFFEDYGCYEFIANNYKYK